MAKYEIIYDVSDGFSEEHNKLERFEGSWTELQAYIKDMKRTGCFNIDATCIDDDEDDDGDDWTSAEDGDYSAAAPWNAPGMSAIDFVRGCR